MEKKRYAKQLGVAVLGLLWLVSSPALVTAQEDVHLLIVDDFAGRELGFIPTTMPNPYSEARSFGAEIVAAAQEVLSALDFRGSVSEARDALLATFEGDILAAIQAEQEQPIDEHTLCSGYLPALKTDGQGHYLVEGVGFGGASPHGNGVVAALLNAAFDTQLPSSLPLGSPEPAFANALTYLRRGDDPITLTTPLGDIQVFLQDTDSFLLQRTEAAIRDRVDSGDPWVINVSFAALPCRQVPTFTSYEAILTAAQHLEQARVDFDDDGFLRATVEQLVGEYQRVMPATTALSCAESPLCTFLNEPHRASVILVAAAGDLGLPDPIFPAGYPQAVSVSASNENRAFFALPFTPMPECALDRNTLCSNAGEVLMPGLFDDYGEHRYGTAFAAPRLSLRLAGYLLVTSGANVCNLLEAPWRNDPLHVWMQTCPALAETRTAIFMD
jgi:hypothetical protein